jgi:hypothetical protein
MKYYLTLILVLGMVGITWAGAPLGPEQYSVPQMVVTPDDGLTLAQIFYYVAGGGAALAVGIKTWLTILKRRKKNV